MTIQLKIAIFYEKRPSLNVEKNQLVLFLETFYEVKLKRSHSVFPSYKNKTGCK
jgi:hypothetical protein